MTDDKYPGSIASTEQNESFFIVGMIIIKELSSVFIVKNSLCFFEGYAVLFEICPRFGWAPLELNHTYIVCIKG